MKPLPPVQVIVDTREKDPWSFDGMGVATVRGGLDAGDYSLCGYQARMSIERKSLDDLVQTLIRQRDRFHAELAKLAQMDYAAVVVEADVESIYRGHYAGHASVASVVGAIGSVCVDWQIPVFFCGSRYAASAFALELMTRFARRSSDRSTPLRQERESATDPAEPGERTGGGKVKACKKRTKTGPRRRGKSPGA